jgi:hypothetical protein
MRVARSFDSVLLPIAIEFTWRTFLFGLALFATLPFAIALSVEQQGLAFVAVAIWRYYDGAFACGNWPRALLEAGVWLFLATTRTPALLLCLGSTEAA